MINRENSFVRGVHSFYRRLTRLSAQWFRNGPDGWAMLPMLLVLMAIAAPAAMAQATAEPASLADSIFQPVVDLLSVLLFFKIGGENGFPFIVLWLFVAAVFFTFRLKFINFWGLKHARLLRLQNLALRTRRQEISRQTAFE